MRGSFIYVCVVFGGDEGREDLGASLLAHRRGHQLRYNRHHRLVFFGEFSVVSCTFECHACVHMGVWNEGEPTDGGGQVVSSQYHHGPASANIIWVLNCVFSGLHEEAKQNKTESEREKEADGVYVKEVDSKVGGRRVECE